MALTTVRRVRHERPTVFNAFPEHGAELEPVDVQTALLVSIHRHMVHSDVAHVDLDRTVSLAQRSAQSVLLERLIQMLAPRRTLLVCPVSVARTAM